jgi:hypothetical protein
MKDYGSKLNGVLNDFIMINLSVDEAYAFDYLSILDIKKNNSEIDFQNFSKVYQSIKSQTDQKIFEEVISSDIYQLMIKANKKIYDLIDEIRIKNVQMDAKIVDDANNQRFFLKKKLQEKFFVSELTEKKSGI